MVGNIPNYTKIDVLRCFLRLEKNIGRQDLADELDLGEGTVRTILDVLKSKKLIDSTKKGHFLSRKGVEILKNIFESVSLPKAVEVKNIYPEFRKVAINIRKAPALNGLYKLRDLAVKNGADGAIILKFENKLYAPESDVERDFGELEKYFELKNKDVLVVAFANNKKDAENGAFAIAVELNSELGKFVEGV
ncbi:hypothetical protein CMO83_04690 [Candidatus Woesearchaeota archaeon]|jgi:predicted transcriptional regulator|nr:hypothetical protein [Candidatus Woesearchaeota archaeon]|tara:strand:+ start:12041 stop:12616 length:576 start_codon:yes stop_codon:yes gene_type:complete